MNEAIKEVAEKLAEQGKREDILEWNYETVKHLRLLLLGQLVEITGIVWLITYDVSKWDIKFDCRFGFGRREALSIGLSLEKYNDYLEDRMSDQAWDIAKAYWKRMKKRYEVSEE